MDHKILVVHALGLVLSDEDENFQRQLAAWRDLTLARD